MNGGILFTLSSCDQLIAPSLFLFHPSMGQSHFSWIDPGLTASRASEIFRGIMCQIFGGGFSPARSFPTQQTWDRLTGSLQTFHQVTQGGIEEVMASKPYGIEVSSPLRVDSGSSVGSASFIAKYFSRALCILPLPTELPYVSVSRHMCSIVIAPYFFTESRASII